MGPSDQARFAAFSAFTDNGRYGLDADLASAATWSIHPFSDSVEPRDRRFEKLMRVHSRKMAKAIRATKGDPEATRAAVVEGLSISLHAARASGEFFYVEKYGEQLRMASSQDVTDPLVRQADSHRVRQSSGHSDSPAPVGVERKARSGGLYGWSLGLGLVSIGLGSTIGLLAWAAVVVSVVALLRGARPSRRRWWAWLGLGLGLVFALVNAELNGHLDRLADAAGSIGALTARESAEPDERDTQSPLAGGMCGQVSVGPHSLYLDDLLAIDLSRDAEYSDSQLETIKNCIPPPVEDTGWVGADSRYACDGVTEERFVSWESEDRLLILVASRGKWAGPIMQYEGEYWTALVASGWGGGDWWGSLGMNEPPQSLVDVQSVPWVTWQPIEDPASTALVLPVFWGIDWVSMVDSRASARLTQSIGRDCSPAANGESQEGLLEAELPDLHPLSAMFSPSTFENQWNTHPGKTDPILVDAFSDRFSDSVVRIEGRQDCGRGVSPCGTQPLAAVVISSSGDLADGTVDQLVANMAVLFDIVEPFPSDADSEWMDAAALQAIGSDGAGSCQLDGTERRTASGFQFRLSCDPLLGQIEFSVVAPLGVFPEVEEIPSIEALLLPSQPMPQLSESVVDDPGYLVFEACSEERTDWAVCNALSWIAGGLRGPRLEGPLGALDASELDAVFCHGWRAGNSAIVAQAPLWPSVAETLGALPEPDISCGTLDNPVSPSAIAVPIAACRDRLGACSYTIWPEPDPTATEAVWCLGASSAVAEAFNSSGLPLGDKTVDAILIDCARRAGYGP